MQGWFDTKRKNNFPVIGLQNEKAELLGFAKARALSRCFPNQTIF